MQFKTDDAHPGLSPIQNEARENEKENKTANIISGGVATVGRGLNKVPNPIAKGAGFALIGIGVATKFAFNDILNKTNPEAIQIYYNKITKE